MYDSEEEVLAQIDSENIETEATDQLKVTDNQLSSLIDQEMSYALGGTGSSDSGSDSELTGAWEEALKYYYGKPRGDEVDGRSKVISMDVADMIEQTIAQLMPSFETPELGEFEAYSDEEEAQAQAESAAINWILLEQNNGIIEFTNGTKDALLMRNGIMKISVEESTEIEEEDLENVNMMMAEQILSQPDLEIISREIIQEPEFDEFENLVVEPLYNLRVRKTIETKQLKAISIAPDEFCVNGDHNSIFLHDARFVCHTTYPTRSDLLKNGYDKATIDLLPAATSKTDEENRARSRDEAENELDSAQTESDRIEVKECYYEVDMDGDGIAERRRIIKASSYILENDIYPVVPFASGTCFLLPHRFWCLSMYDKLKQTQDVKTAFLRKTIDNAEGLINQRTIVVPSQVNMSDVLSSRPTGVVRAKRVDAVAPYPVQNMGDTGFQMLGYMDKVRKEAGGAQLDVGTSENLPVQGQTAHGMERWMSSQEQLSYMMVRTIAHTMIKETYRITHALVRKFMPERLTYKSKGKMLSTIPGSWPVRARVTINIQLSMAERQREYQVLDGILGKQKEFIEKGMNGVMTTNKGMYNALMDQSKAAGFGNASRYWTDPTSQEAQQAQQQNAQQAKAAKDHETQQTDKLLQTQVQISKMQESSDQMKAQLDNAIRSNEQLRKWVELALSTEENLQSEANQVTKLSGVG